MKKVTVRELRQNASVLLRGVEAGETFEITARGRPVAMLGPLPAGSILARLEAEGKITKPVGDLLDLGPPLKPPPGSRPMSEILDEMRADRI